MKAAANIGGHPLHAILTDLPITLWIASFVFDLFYLAQGDLFWYDVAWYLMAGGLLTALVAATFGGIDYFRTVPQGSEARSIAWRHGVLNLGVAVMYAFNLWWRSGQAAASGGDWWLAFTLSLIGVLALAYTGWLGGELVYRHRIGVLDEPSRGPAGDAAGNAARDADAASRGRAG
ncbi:MAG TPA: DUF2231 domain-containing protein [Gemmatimonadota bacterium]|nr:DUF2231 domain-containing protein [Gemmatimonadota bacterium]